MGPAPSPPQRCWVFRGTKEKFWPQLTGAKGAKANFGLAEGKKLARPLQGVAPRGAELLEGALGAYQSTQSASTPPGVDASSAPRGYESPTVRHWRLSDAQRLVPVAIAPCLSLGAGWRCLRCGPCSLGWLGCLLGDAASSSRGWRGGGGGDDRGLLLVAPPPPPALCPSNGK